MYSPLPVVMGDLCFPGVQGVEKNESAEGRRKIRMSCVHRSHFRREGDLSLLDRMVWAGCTLLVFAFFGCSEIRNVYLSPGEISPVSTEKAVHLPKIPSQKRNDGESHLRGPIARGTIDCKSNEEDPVGHL